MTSNNSSELDKTNPEARISSKNSSKNHEEDASIRNLPTDDLDSNQTTTIVEADRILKWDVMFPWFVVRFQFELDGLVSWPALWIALAVFGACLHPEGSSFSSPRLYYSLILLAESTLIGTLFATDIIASLIWMQLALPIVFGLIGGWGQFHRRQVASRFLFFQCAGVILSLSGWTLVSVAWPWIHSDFDLHRIPIQFDAQRLIDGLVSTISRNEIAVHAWSSIAGWSLITLMLGLAFRLPLFPFQSSFKDVILEAPMGVASLVVTAFPLIAICGWIRTGLPLLSGEFAGVSWCLQFAAVWGALAAGLNAWKSCTLTDTVRCLGASQSIDGDGRSTRERSWSNERPDRINDLTLVRSQLASLSTGMISLAFLAIASPTQPGVQGAWLLIQSQGVILTGMFLLFGFGEYVDNLKPSQNPTSSQVSLSATRNVGHLYPFLLLLFGLNCISLGIGSAGMWLTLFPISLDRFPLLFGAIVASTLMIIGLLLTLQRLLPSVAARSELRSETIGERSSNSRNTSELSLTDSELIKGDSASMMDRPLFNHRAVEVTVLLVFVLSISWLTLFPQIMLSDCDRTLSTILRHFDQNTQSTIE
ncbi:MAG: hypothetical protein FJ267_05290 [Planctomycetes bacterium]|nr:hypothetical protein [Planctomycetota bacterium]